MPNLSGKTINKRYKVIESLGRGGMAEVYKVWDTQRQEHLAAKVLREDLAHDLIFLKRFEREARTLAKLQHPNIVRFYGLEQDEMLVMMLMDYIEGESLRELIFRNRGKGLSSSEITRVIQPIATALHYAHQKGIVHCDLKPGNILIDKNGEVYISDFGIARHIDAATMTLIGAGSPAYMAPELVRGQEPTPQSDIYSLGIVLYEMLTGGERPFTGDKTTITGSTAEKVRWEQVRLSPESPRKHNKNISSEMEAVVLQCLEKKQGKRFTSAVALLSVLVGDTGQLEKKPSRRMKQQAQKKDLIQKRKIKPTQRQSADRREKKPIWQRWYLWAGLVAATVVILLTQITLPVIEIPVPPTETPPATAIPTRTPPPAHTPTSQATSTPNPNLGIGSTFISEVDGMRMMFVPEGEFLMGSEDGFGDESPQHRVYLDAYWIDQTEVTNVVYKQCVNNGACDLIGSSYGDIYNNGNDYSNYPVVNVSWYDANAYCQWVGRRLPTEAEWEKAARGDDGRTYPWGENISCSQANYWDCNEFLNTSPVGYYGDVGASPYGAYDMAGNVWEWVADWYDKDYYDNSPVENPFNTNESGVRVLRGGSWFNDGLAARSVDRRTSVRLLTIYRLHQIGFRCAISADDQQFRKE